MAYDYSKLLGRITEKFKCQSNFAKAMGISMSTISKKLNSKKYFSQREIDKACELLSIEKEDIHLYFFTLKVQY